MAQQNSATKYPDFHPNGIYRLKVLQQALGASKNKGTPLLALKCEVLQLKKAQDGRPHTFKLGAHRTVIQYLTPGTADRVKSFLQSCGWPKGLSLNALDPGHPQHFSLVGQEIDSTNKPEKNDSNGKWYDRFELLVSNKDPNAWLSRVGTANTAKMMSLDAIFGASSGFSPTKESAKPSQQTRPTQQKAQPAAQPANDEPPFDVPDGQGDDQVDSGDSEDYNW